MKILQLNSVYGNGSTGKLVESNSRILRTLGHDVLSLYTIPPDLEDGHSRRVCTKTEHLFNSVLSRLNGIPFGGIFLSNSRIYREIASFKPNVVHVHCVNGCGLNIYRLLHHLASKQIKTVVTLHAEFFHTGSCAHACECEQWKSECIKCDKYKVETASIFFNRANKAWHLMNDAFNAFNPKNLIATAVSPWLTKRAEQSAIFRKFRVKYVPNGVNTDVFYHRSNARFPMKIGKNKPTVLFVTPYFSLDQGNLKGGFFIPRIANNLPDVNFVIVATHLGKNISPLPDNVKLFGKAESQEQLADMYSVADLTMLLSTRETFSMVTAESVCCGTPVVGFKAGGPESIALPDYSCFVNYGNIDELCGLISHWLCKSFNKGKISDEAKRAFSEESMTQKFIEVYQNLIS